MTDHKHKPELWYSQPKVSDPVMQAKHCSVCGEQLEEWKEKEK